jgi:hypothetical protein
MVMKMKKPLMLLKAVNYTDQLINDIIFMCENRAKSTYFTRMGKMSFQDVIVFTLNFVKKSLQLELDLFFKHIKGETMSITKQSFSEARQKILPEAFIKIFYQIVEWYYGTIPFKTYKRYRLSAIDGSIIELNNSQILRDAYGYEKNDHKLTARALVSGVYDLENEIMIAAKITRCKYGERKAAMELIDELIRIGVKDDLIIFDRGYPATTLILKLENAGIKYIMRTSTGFLKVVKEAKEPDQVIEIPDGNKGFIKIRIVKFLLDSGVEETLITNLFDQEFGIQELKELYFKRWGVETKYNELKNRLELENFTGDTPIAVEQDFYASMYLGNMVALAKADANATIEKKHIGKTLKYEYKVNTNILIGKLRENFIVILLEKNAGKRSKMLDKLMKELSRNVVPIRPGRNYIRNKNLKSNKFPLNQKRCL